MDKKKTIISIIGLGTVLGTVLLNSRSKSSANVIKDVADAVAKEEPLYKGVPLSRLNDLASEIYHGVKVTVDKFGFLVFHYKSKSGKTNFHSQIDVDSLGKLHNLTNGHYPGQWWSSADEFVKKANELFTFNK